VVAISAFVLAAAVLAGCAGPEAGSGNGAGSATAPGPERGGDGAERASRPPVPTAVAESEVRSRSVQVAGRLRPRTRLTHEVPISGIVGEVPVESGDRVSEGAVLFTVERNEVGQTFRPSPVTARVDGIVSEVAVQRAQEVSAGDSGAVVVGRDGYVLEARVSDKDASGITTGQQVTARTSDGTIVTGRLERRSEEPDYETGLFSVRFRFPEAAGAGIGTFLLVELPTERLEGVFVPRQAIDRRYGRNFLWVIDEAEGVLTRRRISLGEVIGEEVRITEGLAAGERYLLEPTGREREGQPAPPRPDGTGSGD
jgi:multidrug efflux pump subunit AcrA (membrane-fusion protein)